MLGWIMLALLGSATAALDNNECIRQRIRDSSRQRFSILYNQHALAVCWFVPDELRVEGKCVI